MNLRTRVHPGVGNGPSSLHACSAACQTREVAPGPVSFGISAQTCQLRHFSTSRQFIRFSHSPTLPNSHRAAANATPNIPLKKHLVPIHSSPFALFCHTLWAVQCAAELHHCGCRLRHLLRAGHCPPRQHKKPALEPTQDSQVSTPKANPAWPL